MKRFLFFFAFLLLLVKSGFALESLEVEDYCVFDGSEITESEIFLFEPVYGFTNSDEASEMLQKILATIGLEKNFIFRASTVPNAAALIQGNDRYVVWNQNFINQVRQKVGGENADWAIFSILAHEFGHHLEGHTLRAGGSRPKSELEADKYSGFVMYQMGASLKQAQAAMNTFASPQGSTTHPGRSARLAAITYGWNQAKKVDTEIEEEELQRPESRPAEETAPQDEPPKNPTIPAAQTALVAQCIFYQDPNKYFVTNTNDIVGQSPNGARFPVGKRAVSTYPQFAWIYQAPATAYGVDHTGKIWTRLPSGQMYQIGYVLNL